jgi:hypothetical protein
MPKGFNIDDIVKQVLANLQKSNVVDDAAKIGGSVLDDISKTLSEATGKIRTPKKPKPVKPPKSKSVKPPKSETAHHGGTINPKTGKEFTSATLPKPKSPKPESPKSGSADAAEREARRQQNIDNWAKQREAYNKMKAIERQQRKAENRAKWAATLEEKYGGNIVEARKGTSRGRNRNKKKDVK